MPLERKQFSTGVSIPDLDCVVIVACDNPFAIWRESYGVNAPNMPFTCMLPEREYFLSCGSIPDLGCGIATRSNALAIRREGHRQNPASMPLESEQFSTRVSIPHLGGLVPTAGNNPPTIRREGHRGDIVRPLESEQFISCGSIPDLSRGVPTAGDDPLAVWREGHRSDLFCMSLEGFQV